MNGRMAKKIKREVRKLSDKAFAEALDCLVEQPFWKRVSIGWAIVWKLHLRRTRKKGTK